MAKNYSMSEAVAIINEGKDLEAMFEIGRRYPVLAIKISAVVAKAGQDFVDLMNFMPEYLTANKVNSAIKNILSGNEEAESAEEVGEPDQEPEETVAPKKEKTTKAKKEKAETENTGDYASMSGKELWDLLGKAGKRADCKKKMGGTKKEHMVEYINKFGLDEEPVEEATEEPVAEETTTSENPYEGKTAMELFKMCKERKIKAEPKQKAKYYVELLTNADMNEVTAAPAESEDDWDNDEEAEEKPAKKAKAAKKEKPAKKAKEESTESDDDEDDWDI